MRIHREHREGSGRRETGINPDAQARETVIEPQAELETHTAPAGSQLTADDCGTIPPPYTLADVRKWIAANSAEAWHAMGYDQRKAALGGSKE